MRLELKAKVERALDEEQATDARILRKTLLEAE